LHVLSCLQIYTVRFFCGWRRWMNKLHDACRLLFSKYFIFFFLRNNNCSLYKLHSQIYTPKLG
jgi:hypothetical protein